MRNPSSRSRHQAFANIDFSIERERLAKAALGFAGLMALAVSGHHFLSRPDVPEEGARSWSATVHEDAAGASDIAASRSACVGNAAVEADIALANNPETRKNLVAHVEGTYKLPAPLAQKIVNTTIAVSRENDMDPFLALGIIANESSFNHKARSSYGATGLMQIHAPSHQALLEEIGLRERDPKAVQQALRARVKLNVIAGIRIYKAYEKRYGSSIEALQAYNGARQDRTRRYAKKVLAMREDFRKLALPRDACA